MLVDQAAPAPSPSSWQIARLSAAACCCSAVSEPIAKTVSSQTPCSAFARVTVRSWAPGADRTGLGAMADDRREVDQPRHQVGGVVGLDALAGGPPFDRLVGAASDEDRQSAEQGALGLAQQVVAPIDQRPERLLARQRRAAPASE